MEILYTFIIPENEERSFHLNIDDKTITLKKESAEDLPEWCSLSVNQCPHCPFDSSTLYCPVAENLEQAVGFFSGIISYDKAYVIVKQANRHVYCDTSVQNGLKSLMGLLMATSKCPHTDFFKPMARFHLPFADSDETIWRSASSFILGQYLQNRGKTGKNLSLEPLKEKYRAIEILNSHMASRLVAGSKKDSTVNALISLDIFAKKIGPALEDKLLSILHIYQSQNRQ